MAVRPQTHRPATLARREALLRAAADLVAERGVRGVTHRDVAARAGVPLSTTSYFFGSLEELVLAALRLYVEEAVARLDAVAEAIVRDELTAGEGVERFAAALAAIPPAETLAQFEAYLEAGRRPELCAEVGRVIGAFERVAAAALAAAGAEASPEQVRAFVALADGFALHRMARPAEDDRAALAAGLRALLAGIAG